MFAKYKRVLFLLFAVALGGCEKPDFVDAEGNEFDWQDFQGRWLVINYWAEWCKPCLEEMPELNSLYQKRGDRDLYLLGINFDPLELPELEQQINALQVQFPVLYTDREKQLDYLYPEVLPTTYLFDPEGKLRHKLVGPQTADGIEALIQEGHD